VEYAAGVSIAKNGALRLASGHFYTFEGKHTILIEMPQSTLEITAAPTRPETK
jgi:hypothetical protein